MHEKDKAEISRAGGRFKHEGVGIIFTETGTQSAVFGTASIIPLKFPLAAVVRNAVVRSQGRIGACCVWCREPVPTRFPTG